jgi:hypothetical protein
MYSLTEYITEKTLGNILVAWAGEENVKFQPMLTGTRMRHDFEVKKDGVTYSVEFNGDSHYRDPSVIYRDWVKEEISKNFGRKVVQIPYFIQLNTETFKIFFDADFEIETTYPHGFVATKMLPASFCPLGYNRALADLQKMPASVQADVMASLKIKAEKLGDPWVYHINHIDLPETNERISWGEFVKRANLVHDNVYEYVHPL